jgi:hypothetical protein
MISSELEQEIRNVAALLSVLSEVSASTLEPRTSHGKSESQEPTGTASSLYDWFVREVRAAQANEDLERLEKLVGLGRIRHEQRSVHMPRRTLLRAGTLDNPDMPREGKDAGVSWPAPEPLIGRAYEDEAERPNQARETEDAAAERVVEWYEGVDALAVAVNENTTEVWVRKARKKHNRHPEDGRKIPPFLQWDDEERRRQIDLLRARAKSEGREIGAKTIANHFGVDKNTVKRYLDRDPIAA